MSLKLKCQRNLNVPKTKMFQEPFKKNKKIGTDRVGFVFFISHTASYIQCHGLYIPNTASYISQPALYIQHPAPYIP